MKQCRATCIVSYKIIPIFILDSDLWVFSSDHQDRGVFLYEILQNGYKILWLPDPDNLSFRVR